MPNPREVNVVVAGLSTNFDHPASLNTNLNRGLQTLTFNAIGSTSTLTFASVDGSGFWGPLLDNLSVVQVPLPGSLALLCLGLAGLGLLRRRNPSRSAE